MTCNYYIPKRITRSEAHRALGFKPPPDSTEPEETLITSPIFVCGNLRIEVCGVGKCLHEAEYQCDYPIDAEHTCDRFLCERHARNQSEGIDYCPEHYQAPGVVKVFNPKVAGK